jgi:uncharacterized SAM-binding protein YcdF (DUF218 family)
MAKAGIIFRRLWARRWMRVLSIFCGLLFTLVFFRNQILRGIGNWLVAEDEIAETEACFVLGGNSYERGRAAVTIHGQYPSQHFVATGGNFPYQILCLDTSMFEAELTHHMMVNHGIPAAQVETLTSAHSTMEESDEILAYCLQKNLHDISVISSSFHLRRVRWVFEDKFKAAGISVHFIGAQNNEYDAGNWWHNEEGLIMANNEIVKLAYYLVKY